MQNQAWYAFAKLSHGFTGGFSLSAIDAQSGIALV